MVKKMMKNDEKMMTVQQKEIGTFAGLSSFFHHFSSIFHHFSSFFHHFRINIARMMGNDEIRMKKDEKMMKKRWKNDDSPAQGNRHFCWAVIMGSSFFLRCFIIFSIIAQYILQK